MLAYGSICSGIEAASMAWRPLGWTPVFFAETEKFPSAVLKERHPGVPNWGDITRFKEWPDARIDLLVGGTPCQSFSVAGLRKGLDDPRGNLMLTYLAIARRYRPRWLVWENVPGVLSSLSHGAPDPCPPPDPLDLERDGQEVELEDEYDSEELHAFNCFVAGLSELGYGFDYRVLDAQFFGVPQRRRRVFVVGYLGDWRRAAAVLFERHSLSWDSPPRREAGQAVAGTLKSGARSGGLGHGARSGIAKDGTLVAEVAPTIGAREKGGGGLGTDADLNGALVARSLNANGQRFDGESETFIAHSLRADGFDASEDGTGRGVPLTFGWNKSAAQTLRVGETSEALQSSPTSNPAVAFTERTRADGRNFETQEEIAYALTNPGSGGRTHSRQLMMQVRRLTPMECERLQGFSDNYTLITYRKKPAADGPRYKALGNSMAVPVMRWIGERIEEVESL
jgi:DNA (cytosine-5)-methyltransferase 1